jgi:hypothetical protein
MDDVAARLSAPFDPREIKFKPQMVKNNRALAMAYIDSRLVMDRLDEVVGVDGWEDKYEVLDDGSVVCTLRVRMAPSEWVTKQDVGSLSEQPDAGDRLKAAFSDALKRAAVKFGIGRYLYRLPAQWVDYDPVKKMILAPPQLPDWAIPARQSGGAKAAPKPAAQVAKPGPVDAKIVEEWRKVVRLDPDLEAMNGQLKHLPADANDATKNAVWNVLKGYADLAGWEYDPKAKVFVAPVEADAGLRDERGNRY